MFGLPGQTLNSWESTLRQAIAMQPEHISTYCLILEEDTVFWQAFKRGLLAPDEDVDTEMFRRGIAILEKAGYRHYEIANFAKPGFECRHNIAYWRGRNYYGLGPGAFSTVRSRRWMNVADTVRYVNAITKNESPRVDVEELTPLVLAGERAAFGLRMMKGISAAEFKADTGFELLELWPLQIARLIEDGLLEWRSDCLRLTSRGILHAARDQWGAEGLTMRRVLVELPGLRIAVPSFGVALLLACVSALIPQPVSLIVSRI
jgi:oxygen-independent coproporphyrinogen-3 oxidase